jgi:hypothetical protein
MSAHETRLLLLGAVAMMFEPINGYRIPSRAAPAPATMARANLPAVTGERDG